MSRTALQHKAAQRRTEMVDGAVYMTPTGRLCKLLPEPRLGIGSDGMTKLFAYLRHDGVRLSPEGFNLHLDTARRILQRVA